MKKEYLKLELNKVLDLLANEACSEQCRENIAQIEPCFEPALVRMEVKKADDAFVLSAKFGSPRFYKIKNLCGSVKRAQSGGMLSLRELLDAELVLREISGLCDWYSQCENIENSLSDLFLTLVPNKPLRDEINMCVVSEEEISDNASPELARIRRSIMRQGQLIKEQLDKIIRSQSTQKFLQDAIVTQRDGRYVVPVRTEHKNDINGLVHDTSASGATLFIEPMSVVEANNEIRVLKGQEQLEIERIIKALSQKIADYGEDFIAGYEAAITLETYFAKASLATRMRATAPQICDEPILYLNKARHPLINKDDVVPTTITLGETYSCLIVTGPNTGGKTVAIKTAGLLTLMTMCGLLIPVSDGSKVGIFSEIYADIGDEQSIEQSLSTFSSHMTNIVGIMKNADEKALILLDELGSGTDPVEGAALAVTILRYLKNSGCSVIATTHYQEVKMFALEEEGVENACCEFDVKTLKPTYKLIIGVPGKSNAFAIARRLGMSDDIIESANQLVSEENKRFEKVVDELEKSRQELETAKENVRLEERRTKELTEKLENQRKQLEAEMEKEIAAARKKALDIVEEVRFNADLLIEDLEKLKKEKDKEDFSERVRGARSKMNNAVTRMYNTADPVVEKKNDNYKLPRPLRNGDTVRLVDIDKTGYLITAPDSSGNCQVQLGIMKLKTNVKNLRLIEEKNNAKPMQKKGYVTKTVESAMTRKSSMELDIRGMMSDDGIMAVEGFIDSCLLSGLQFITIIHGKGTGALRAAVTQYLKTNPSVKSFRPGVYGEGEAGVTVVELKQS